MRKTNSCSFTITAVCLSLFATLPASRVHARELLELPAANFTVYSALPERETRQFAQNLEDFDRVVAGTSGVAQRRNAGPTRVFLLSFSDYQKYFQFRDNVAAFFSDTSGISNDIVMPVSGGSGNVRSAYPIIFHEYSHFIIRTQFPGVCPQWFDEGLAELLSTATFREGRIRFTAPRDRLYALKELPWIPADQLLKVKTTSREYSDHTLAGSFYAESWLLMHYAFVANPQVLRQLVTYIIRINQGQSSELALQNSLGRDVAALDSELRTYSRQRAFRDGEIVSPRDRVPITAPARKLDAAESARTLGELSLRLRLTSTGLEALLKEALKARPGDSRTLAALAELAASQEQFDAAREYLKSAEASFDAQDSQVAASLGEAHWRLATAMQPPQEGRGARFNFDKSELKTALGFFEKAVQAGPGDLRAAHDYASMCGMLGECMERATEVLMHAQSLAPASWVLALDLAQIHAAMGKSAEATRQWRLVARLARDADTRDLALNQLASPSGSAE